MNAVTIQGLKKVYGSKVIALDGVDLSIEAGDFFALLGPNGAGKTTLIGILTSLVTKTAGKVLVYDHDIDHALDEAKACIGVVPQEFNFNIFESVERILLQQAGYYGLPRRLAKERTEKYLRKLDLWDRRSTTARFLSGGMKRRLIIARALVHEPKLLILDEPTAGVDIEIRRSMWSFLLDLNRSGTTIILTTHYLEEAESLCRHIAVINHGRIVEHGEQATVLRKLHMQTFVLHVKEPLTHAPSLPDFPCRLLDPFTLEVELLQEHTVNALFDAVGSQNIVVESMKSKRSRLEEYFMKLIER